MTGLQSFVQKKEARKRTCLISSQVRILERSRDSSTGVSRAAYFGAIEGAQIIETYSCLAYRKN